MTNRRNGSGGRAAMWAAALLFLFVSPSLFAQDVLLDILSTELQREISELQRQEVPPYYIGYRVSDVRTASARASFGSLTGSASDHSRLMDVSVRVGSYGLDNTRKIRGDYFSDEIFQRPGSGNIPIEDSPDAIRAAVWKRTSDGYRKAVERFAKVNANIAVKVAAEDTSADFSREAGIERYEEEPLDFTVLLGDRKMWEEKVKRYSLPFLESKEIFGGNASFVFSVERKYLVTSEGARITQNLTYARLFVTGFIKSDDGMELPLYKSYFAFQPSGLPPDDSVLADVRRMIAKLEALRTAPVVDPYTGPALLSGRASGVFFHEIFGHRIEGHRQKDEEEGQTFKKKIGEQILPGHMDILFDPTRKELEGTDLIGYYRFDDEGIKTRPVNVVDAGVLRNFLMSRSPIAGFPISNGHGRAQSGYSPVSRQSNLIVRTAQPQPIASLRRRLIDECKKQGKSYGLLFQDIEGGFTITGRTIPNAFNVLPTEVYRIYTDGRPDELVRGVDLVGTPLAMFSRIAEAGDRWEIFTGICGAESGGVPVSACSPSLFVEQVEVQKKEKSQERPPILPRPDADAHSSRTP